MDGFTGFTFNDDTACFFYMCKGRCPDGAGCHSCDEPQGYLQLSDSEYCDTYNHPANTKHLYNIYTKLYQRRRRWDDVV